MSDNTRPTTDLKIEAVQRLYEAYGRGDVDAVLAELADDVDWAAEAASTSVPWYGHFRGKSEVPRFFKEIASNVEVTEFS
jgi:ketosteroid isomerase-like protein